MVRVHQLYAQLTLHKEKKGGGEDNTLLDFSNGSFGWVEKLGEAITTQKITIEAVMQCNFCLLDLSNSVDSARSKLKSTARKILFVTCFVSCFIITCVFFGYHYYYCFYGEPGTICNHRAFNKTWTASLITVANEQ